jgi:hypothetical protein
MEHWFSVDIERRREELYAQAVRARLIRLLESGRSSGLRGRIADHAESLSDALAHFARAVRGFEKT